RIGIQILNDKMIEAWIGGELFAIHSQSGDTAVFDLRRQMADPARHQIENRAPGRKEFSIKLRDSRNRTIVDMRDEAWLRIENRVGRFVVAREGRWRQAWNLHVVTSRTAFPAPRARPSIAILNTTPPA